MSTAATPSNDQAAKAAPAKPKSPVPPEEKFWQHYSPHHEFPLSSVSSFTLHALVIGLFVLMAVGIIKFGGKEKMPVEAVHLDLGGGGGSKSGSGDAKGVGSGLPEREDPGDTPKDPANPVEPTKPPELDPGKVTETKVDFEDELVRYVKAGDDAKKAFSNL